MRDLYGVQPLGLPDPRPWLDHGRWPGRQSEARYDFLPSEGEGLHQIPVGPVHAGIIEPGHFRFTANGETVVRLEERLGYVHKGVEGLLAGADIARGARIVGRISGDSTVAYAWAFARAVEAALGWPPPPRAVLLRGVMAELERLGAPHQRCRRDLQRRQRAHHPCPLRPAARGRAGDVAEACFGHRLMMDRIVPGGVAADLSSDGIGRVRGLLGRLEATRAEIQRVYDSMPSLQDRTVTTGIVSPELVAPVCRRRLRRPRVGPRLRRAQELSPMRPMTSLDFEPQDADQRATSMRACWCAWTRSMKASGSSASCSTG